MREDGILPSDVVAVRTQGTARNGQTVMYVAAFPIPPTGSARVSLTGRRGLNSPCAYH